MCKAGRGGMGYVCSGVSFLRSHAACLRKRLTLYCLYRNTRLEGVIATMVQEQQMEMLEQKQEKMAMLSGMSRAMLLMSLLVGAILLVFFLVMELLLVLVFHLGHGVNNIGAFLAFLFSTPLFVLLPLLAFVLGIGISLWGMRPLAFILYLRNVHTSQECYQKNYIPLIMSMTVRKGQKEELYGAEAAATVEQEQQLALVDVLQQDDMHLVMLGTAGIGKTMALHVYLYGASEMSWQLARKEGKIPVSLSLLAYSLFLKQRVRAETEVSPSSVRDILAFLSVHDVPGMRYLHPHLDWLMQQGRLVLLCDGLDEVEESQRGNVCQSLIDCMRTTQNRVVVTSHSSVYAAQRELVQYIESAHARLVTIAPLQTGQVAEIVEKYIERQDKNWKHTAGQVLHVLERSRLRDHCSNPMMLFTFLGIIDKIGVERGKQIDTRGLLLREAVHQLVLQEQRRAEWAGSAPKEEVLSQFLRDLACATHWHTSGHAVQVKGVPGWNTKRQQATDLPEVLTQGVQVWLKEHPAYGPYVEHDEQMVRNEYEKLPDLLRFSLQAGLLEWQADGMLRFSHELIAEYLVAEYYCATMQESNLITPTLYAIVHGRADGWSEPVALWAGLLDSPFPLAENLLLAGRDDPDAVLQALALSLVCIGVTWRASQMETPLDVPPMALPARLADAISLAVHHKVAREDLARRLIRCAEEGAQEVYHAVVLLVAVDGVDELLVLLDKQIVPDLFFQQLQDIVDVAAYEAQVRQITRVLGRFGRAIVDRATQFSRPLPERSVRLRAAAVDILRGTEIKRAVEPLIACLSDTEPIIVKRAATALAYLGPEFTLTSILEILQERTVTPLRVSMHQASLAIVEHFLDEKDVRRRLSLTQYQAILDVFEPILTSLYQTEPTVQQRTRAMLTQQARMAQSINSLDNRWEKVIELLLFCFVSQDEIASRNALQALQEIGEVATMRLLELPEQGQEQVRLRTIDVLRVTRDLRALPYLLRLMSDEVPAIQQAAATILRLYAPESIPGLIDLVFSHPDELVAGKAAQTLSEMGPEVIGPITNVIFHIIPERTRLLVQVLERIHDAEALPPLLALLQTPQLELLLMIAVIRALGQFPEQRVVVPLLHMLVHAQPQVYEEAINALSRIWQVAFDGLLAALDVPEETVLTQRVQRVLLCIMPFPAEQLVQVLASCTELQARQVISTFMKQRIDVASTVVKHLLHPDKRVRGYVYQILEGLPGSVVVPALLEMLNQSVPLRRAASILLLNYPDAAIPSLVALLGEHERGEAAVDILPQFGIQILHALISGLDDQQSGARERARRIVVVLVQQSQEQEIVLRKLMQLFTLPPPPRAREALLEVLTNDLAPASLPALLEGLEDAHLLGDAAEALFRLTHQKPLQRLVLEQLLQALWQETRRSGAEMALVKIGALAVPAIGGLIVDSNPVVAKTAKRILRSIGASSLPFIWAAYINTAEPVMREAALDVFHSMPTEIIKDDLVKLLSSQDYNEVAMALSLLIARIYDESMQPYADNMMIPELLEYVQTHSLEEANQRIIALLLVLGERVVLRPLLQTLDDFTPSRRQLVYMLLLLGGQTQERLLEVFQDADVSVGLRTEIAAMLAMLSNPLEITEYAQSLSAYGFTPVKSALMFPGELNIGLHALGGLLASGQWNDRVLEGLRSATVVGSAQHELFSVLLGWRYVPQIEELQRELDGVRDSYKREVLALTAKMLENQRRIQSLEDELEQVQKEHEHRGDQLSQTSREKDSLGQKIDKLMRECDLLQERLEQSLQENDVLRERVARLQWELEQ